VAKLLDWYLLKFVTLRWPPNNSRDPQIDDALQFLRGPDFRPTAIPPAQVQFIGPLDFTFPTPRPGESTANNTVHGRLYRAAEPWQKRPAIILLHGWRDSFHQSRHARIARQCNRAGYNVTTYVAPHHFQRDAGQLGKLNYLEVAYAIAQAIAEVRALTGWLLAAGCPSVTVWGFSMGGWLAGLTAGCEPRLHSVILNMPVVRLDPTLVKLFVRRDVPDSTPSRPAEFAALNQTAWNLTTMPPVIPKENILLVESIHDLIIPKESVEALWRAWQQPEIWRLRHGHVSWLFVPGFTRRALNWLASKK
jgi:pimeloyl-ACP methyl ester carboxylesterase